MNTIPDGFCQCGCGERTNIIKETHLPRGRRKGEYFKYIHGHNSKQDIEKRFWKYVNKCSVNECWEWTGCRNYFGYGRISVNGKPQKAHRVSYRITYGPIPENKLVLHKCNNPSCVNPKHLYLGNHKDNSRDMMNAGRNKNKIFRGSESPVAKLTEEQVIEMRKRFDLGNISITQLSKDFNISESQTSRIVKRQSWVHI